MPAPASAILSVHDARRCGCSCRCFASGCQRRRCCVYLACGQQVQGLKYMSFCMQQMCVQQLACTERAYTVLGNIFEILGRLCMELLIRTTSAFIR